MAIGLKSSTLKLLPNLDEMAQVFSDSLRLGDISAFGNERDCFRAGESGSGLVLSLHLCSRILLRFVLVSVYSL
jgi:hypothetical protein